MDFPARQVSLSANIGKTIEVMYSPRLHLKQSN